MLQPVDGTADDSANSLKTHDENNGSSENASGIDKNHTEKEKEDEGFIDNVKKNHRFRLLGREKPIHHVLGGGKCIISFINQLFDMLDSENESV